jgi:arylsulfatase A-like enzyme
MILRNAVAVTLGVVVGGAAAQPGSHAAPADSPTPRRAPAQQPRNIVLILSDDHRYDFMGFMDSAPQFLETPALDRMAERGAHIRNAFVTTALCSPSRASILTGQYAHRHRVVDNTSPIPPGTVFFPEHLQRAGYQTAYIGKWHMGEDAESDAPRPGFDHWISFRGQGVYHDPVLNVDGARRQFAGYTTDLLTDHALAWLDGVRASATDRPFFLMLAHKAVHAEFEPARRHVGRYDTVAIPYPETMANTVSNAIGLPRWAQEQRYSWHGVEHMFHGALDFDTFYRAYTETLLALDESVGRIVDYLDDSGLSESTLVVYMSDNGFLLGEHGLIDKRQAYEESIRIPCWRTHPAGSRRARASMRWSATSTSRRRSWILPECHPCRRRMDDRCSRPSPTNRWHGPMSCYTSTTGSTRSRTRLQSSRCARTASSTSTTTACGTRTSCSIWLRTRRSGTT